MSGAPPPAMPAPAGGDTNREAALIAVWWIMSFVVIQTLVLRLWARIKIHSLGIDDWLMLFSGVLFVETAIVVTYYASIGGTRHMYYLTGPEIVNAIKFNWLSQPCAIFALFTTKASVAFLVLRLLGPQEKIRRFILYFIIVTIFLFNTIGLILTFVQCTPVDALWNQALLAEGAVCWDPNVQAHYNYFNGAWNVLVDIVLAVMPASFIMNLNMSFVNKVRLSILLGLGLVAAVFAIIKTYYLTQLTARADITYMTFDVMCWAGAELLVIIVCGSIPTMKPLYDHYVKDKRFSNWARSFGSTFRPIGRGTSTNKSGYTKDSLGSSTHGASPFNTMASKGRRGDVESVDDDGRVPLAPLGKKNSSHIIVTNDFDVESSYGEYNKDRSTTRYERV